MDEAEIKKLTHDFLNSVSIVTNLSKSTVNLLDKMSDTYPMLDPQIESIKQAMELMQHEMSKTKNYFLLLAEQ